MTRTCLTAAPRMPSAPWTRYASVSATTLWYAAAPTRRSPRVRLPCGARTPNTAPFAGSFARLVVADLELLHRAVDDEIVVIEHQRTRDAVLVQFERHRIERRLLTAVGLGRTVVIAHRHRPAGLRLPLVALAGDIGRRGRMAARDRQ